MATHSDWLALVELSGLVISEPVLESHFPDGPRPLPAGAHRWFQRFAERFEVSQAKADPAAQRQGATTWIDYLVQWVMELPGEHWRKGAAVPDELVVDLEEYEQQLRPDRVLMRNGRPALLMMVVPPGQGLDRRESGAGRWKASPTTKLDRLLRDTGHPLGLVTNGHAFRLVHARQGTNTGHITWTTRLLTEEKAALDAFHTLVNRDVLLPKGDEALSLADLCRVSIDRQGDVADQLGEQVRSGLERLIWAWDAADRDAAGALLRDMDEDGIYEMGLVTMMRLVFMLYAEERALLPHGQVLYDQGYGLTWLWHRLQEQRREAPARMDESFDAWDRFLATCRLIHGGSRHPDLPLIAYGGSLFDPDRFPVLEVPGCRVPNRVMYKVLQLLLFARQRKGGEPQRVGYWALDVEQIGYVYEGLLDHRCARAGDQPMVKLRGAGEAAIPLPELEAAASGWEPGEDPETNPPPRSLAAAVAGHLVKKVKDEHIEKTAARLSAPPEARDLEHLKRFPAAVADRARAFANVIQCEELVPPRWRFLTTGTSRRASGAHYTPQSLTERVVRVTLEPQVYRCEEGKPGKYLEPRQVRSPRELLDLKVCDIAMGSGAFLVQAVRSLGDRLVDAWDRALAEAQESRPGAVLSMPFAEPTDHDAPLRDRDIDPENREEMTLWARRFVAERCIYGVDVNPLAVEMSKLSLWLTTLARDRAFTFLDHALKCGDSLVGVDEKQLSTWSLDGKGSGAPLLATLLARKVSAARALRAELQRMPVIDADDVEAKRRLLEKADALTNRLRLAGDLLVAPSFAGLHARKQGALRASLQGHLALDEDKVDWDALRRQADRLLQGQRTFHWILEFPEVFRGEGGGFAAIVGNPPFVGGQFIRRQLGDEFLPWLRQTWPHSHGTADLVAFFFLRAFGLLAFRGTFGLIATNTIGQGDTRESGLDRISADRGSIFAAVPRMPWPGAATVNVSLVHVLRSEWHGLRVLDGAAVETISSSLDSAAMEVGPPTRLHANAGLSFQGSNVLGLGFTMSPAEAQALIAANPRNAEVLFSYLNGKDLNTHPAQKASRWVINFRDWPLEKAAEWPELMDIVTQEVKPQREAIQGTDSTSEDRRRNWWRFTRPTVDLYNAITPLARVLVVARTAKYRGYCLVPPAQVLDANLVVFASDQTSFLAVLQSNVHEAWVAAQSSTLDTRQGYRPTDCFETFPFPSFGNGPGAYLEELGEELHEHRRQLMLANNEGLTKTYNRFHNPEDKTPGIVRLRALHVEMDNAVRDAYGWSDLDLEHGWLKSVTVTEKKNRKTGKVEKKEKEDWRYTISERAKGEVLRRLLALNHERYEEEVKQGLHDKKKGKQAGTIASKAAVKADAKKEDKPFRLTPKHDSKKGPRLL
ncbi:MAG: DNA methyltransferase [Pseudomonadota bacterium]